MGEGKTILVVDDEVEIRSLLKIFLDMEDFDIVEADTGKTALRQAVAVRPDLILLDLGLPDLDGQEIIQSVRKFSNLPIIVLTARSDDQQMVKALAAGADDYVIKPFRAEVLLARIKANLRSTKSETAPTLIHNGPIEIDLTRHEVFLAGKRTSFTPKEFDMLQFFITNRGKMMTHKQILRDVWGPHHTDDTQYLRVYLGQIRAKLNVVPGLSQSITSESGVGYRMEVLADEPVGGQTALAE